MRSKGLSSNLLCALGGPLVSRVCIRFPSLLVVLVLSALSLPAQSGRDVARARITPWAGYWWPSRASEAALVTGKNYHGRPAPLEKYDALVKGSFRSDASIWELNNHFFPESDPSWFGHCPAWAAASIFEPEPAAAGYLNGIRFNVGDKKGLLTEAYAPGVVGRMFGQQFPSGDISDVSPDIFHRTVIEFIKVLGKPIIIDIDPGPALWHFPAYQYEMTWTDDRDTRHVTCQVKFADNRVHPDEVGEISFALTFTYDLFLDRSGNIVGGRWTGQSAGSNFGDHPDYLIDPVGGVPENPFLDVAKAREIASSRVNDSDDIFEPNDSPDAARPLAEGSYVLRFLNEDWFKICLDAGEGLTVELDFKDAQDDIGLVILNSRGEAMAQVATSGKVITAVVQPATVTANELFLKVSVRPGGSPPAGGNYYLTITKNTSKGLISHLANDGGWFTDIYLTNANNSEVQATFTVRSFSGQINAAPKTLNLGPRQHLAGKIQDLVPEVNPADARWASVISNKPLLGFFAFGPPQAGLSRDIAAVPFQSAPASGSKILYLPHVAAALSWWTGVALLNPNTCARAHVEFKLYSEAGKLLASDSSLTLRGGEQRALLIEELFPGMEVPNGSWLKVEADVPISGFALIGTKDITQLETVPLQSQGAQELFVPFVPDGDSFWTGLTLLNTSQNNSLVDIVARSNINGAIVGSVSLQLARNQKVARLLQEFFPGGQLPQGTTWLSIRSSQPLVGFVLFGSFSGRQVSGFVLPGAPKGQSFLIARAFGPPQASELATALVLLDIRSEKPNNIRLVPFSADGRELAPVAQFATPFKGNLIKALDDLYPQGLPEGAAYFVLQSEFPVIGLQLYGARDGTSATTVPIFELPASAGGTEPTAISSEQMLGAQGSAR